MNIVITGLAGIRDAVIASGVKQLLEGMSFGVTVEIAGAARAPAPVEPAAEIPAPKKRGRKPGVKVAPKPAKVARKQVAKPVAAAPATSGGADGRGSIRDAVRAALTTSGRDLTTIVQAVQRTFPEKNRDYIGTVLCQLSKGGECELGPDSLWRKSE